ncbi:hypothetical protein PBY51_019853 [Eleginops maclovinus]|uniref:Uncharacterized protein n=1 Tax=Eleginops maclovinus TaxID=56733 RepID=A0AAN7XLB3_ELEMC|nr:hypothetical protein PBY51_019853 [Eleginops maclovinus]
MQHLRERKQYICNCHQQRGYVRSKAAMKAKQQAAEAEKAAKDAGNDEANPSFNSQEPQPEGEVQPADLEASSRRAQPDLQEE